MVKQLGVSPDTVKALRHFEQDERFSPREKAALRLAEALTRSGKAVDDDLYAQLTEHFDEGEIVELLCSCGVFAYFNRIADALRVEITK